MAVKKIKVNGRWVWQARVAYRGLRKSTIRASKDEAKTAEAALRTALKEQRGQADQEAQAPATLRALFESYVVDLEHRGKGSDTIGRAIETAHVIERLMPDLLDRAVTTIGGADLFAFRKRRREGGTKPSTINRDLRTLRAMLKSVCPAYRVPPGLFFPEDETRVRWLRPEEELLVLETMRSPFREIAKLAALTLMRLSEIRTLRREHVHLAQGVVMLRRAKAGARPVILRGEAQAILGAQLQGHKSEWVFPGPGGGPYERSYVGRV